MNMNFHIHITRYFKASDDATVKFVISREWKLTDLNPLTASVV
jgi:hypothetical protein